MKLGVPAEIDRTLAVRLAWLTALRLFVLTAILAVTAAVQLKGLPGDGPSSRIALVTVTAAYGLAAIYANFLRSGRALRKVAAAQLVTDQITWTAIVYITGGVSSGATSLYGLTCLYGAVAIGLRGAVLGGVTGALAYGLLCAGLAEGFVPAPGDHPAGAYEVELRDVAYPLFVNVIGIGVVATLASHLAERLRQTGGRLEVANILAAEAKELAEKAEERAEQAERLAALGRLAAGLAHEIRNPLSSIAGSIELLRTGGELSPEDARLCEIIERETSRLNDLVTDMLELSRRRVPAKTRCDLAAVTRDVTILAARSGRGADVAVRYEGPESLFTTADPALLRQVIWNLLRNAIQASSAGDEVVVRLSGKPGGQGTVAFEDRGEGIAPEARARLFDAYFTTRSQGAGIGLAVVKQIVDDHGFSLEVESEPGQGTTFTLRFPVEEA